MTTIILYPDQCRPRCCFVSAWPEVTIAIYHGYRHITNYHTVRACYRGGVQLAFRYY